MSPNLDPNSKRLPALDGMPAEVSLEAEQIRDVLKAFMIRHGIASLEEAEVIYKRTLGSTDESPAPVTGETPVVNPSK